MTEPGVEPIVIEVDAPVDTATAWQAITDPEQVAEWFADVTPIDGIGSPYRVDFGDGSAAAGRIRGLDRGRSFAYTWAWEGEDGPVTLVTWAVEPARDGGSRIVLTHDGWAEAEVDADTRDDHADAWEGYMAELEAILGSSSGVPVAEV
jgi:uncharacterized protein YndB with AHSA1/START domain